MDEIMQEPYKVLVRTDEFGRITAIDSDAFLKDTTGWIYVDEGYGDKYHHAQGNYLDKFLMDERGIYRYKLVDGVIVERTQEEMDSDYVEPEAQPTDAERIAQLEEQNVMLTECLLEMSEIVYA